MVDLFAVTVNEEDNGWVVRIITDANENDPCCIYFSNQKEAESYYKLIKGRL